MSAANRWLLTWTTYGTWLPGDARGFVGYVHDPAMAPVKNPLTGVNGSIPIHEPTTSCEPTTPVVGLLIDEPVDSRQRLEGDSRADDAQRANDAQRADDASRRVSSHRAIHNIPGTPYDRNLPALERYAREQMKGDPVWLTRDQAETFLAEARRTAAFRNWLLFAAAIMANHVHLVVGVPTDLPGERLLQEFKSYGSRVLNQRFGKPKSGTWWTKSGSTRLLPGEGALTAAIEYVRNQQRPLTVWIAEDHGDNPSPRVDSGGNPSTRVDSEDDPSTGVDGSKIPCEPTTRIEPTTPVVGSDTDAANPNTPGRKTKGGGE